MFISIDHLNVYGFLYQFYRVDAIMRRNRITEINIHETTLYN